MNQTILCTGGPRPNIVPRILFVGGTFSDTPNPDGSYGAASGLVRRFCNELDELMPAHITTANGGNYEHLRDLLTATPDYDYVFW